MPIKRMFIVLSFIFLAPGWSISQEAATEEVKSDPPKKKNMELAVEMTTTIMMKMYEKAGLDESQKEQIGAILNGSIRELVYKRQEFQEILSKEERRKFNAAKKQAKRARYSEEKAEQYALKKLKLPEDVLKRYQSLKTDLAKLDVTVKDSILELLSEEQKSKLSPKLFGDDKKADSKAIGGSAKKPSDASGGSDKK